MLQGELSNALGDQPELTVPGSAAHFTKPMSRSTGSVSVLARAFPVWNRSTNPYNWCHKSDGTISGILFVKVPKCASSTGSGVAGRIADTLGRRMLGGNHTTGGCHASFDHGIASHPNQDYGSRQADRSVLWTMIRHPVSRVMSDIFFFRVSRKKRNATEDLILKSIQEPHFKAFTVDYMKLKKFKTKEEEIEHAIQNYDFIAVSERMAESLVVMSIILKIPLADLVVLSSKAGDYDDGTTRHGCMKLTRAWTTPKIDAYLQGDFLQGNYDMILYQAVNASLDLTIDALGRDRVVAGVAEYNKLAAKNKRDCEQHAIFPCPHTGPNHQNMSQQDCYFKDSGCGHSCTDKALQAESDDEWNRLQMAWLFPMSSSMSQGKHSEPRRHMSERKQT